MSNKLTWYSRKDVSGPFEKTVLDYGQFCFVGPVQLTNNNNMDGYQ